MSTRKDQVNSGNPNNVGLGEPNRGEKGEGNPTDQQPGAQRKGAENSQAGRDGSEHQPGTVRKGAETTQAEQGTRPAGARDTDDRGTLGGLDPDPLASDDPNDVETGSAELEKPGQKEKADTTSGARK